MQEKIAADFKEAFKIRDAMKLGVLKLLRSELANAEIAKKGKGDSGLLNDEEVMQIILREVKKRKDAEDLYTKGGRKDLAENERAEMDFLKNYLPEEMPEGEIRKIVKMAIGKTGATNIKDLGKVMAEVSPKTKGRADGFLVSVIVKETLSS